MQKSSNKSKSEMHLESLIAEAGADARKRRQASMKAHTLKLRKIQKANSANKKVG